MIAMSLLAGFLGLVLGIRLGYQAGLRGGTEAAQRYEHLFAAPARPRLQSWMNLLPLLLLGAAGCELADAAVWAPAGLLGCMLVGALLYGGLHLFLSMAGRRLGRALARADRLGRAPRGTPCARRLLLLPLGVLLPALAWATKDPPPPQPSPEDWRLGYEQCVQVLGDIAAQRWWWGAGGLLLGILAGAALGVWGLLRWMAADDRYVYPPDSSGWHMRVRTPSGDGRSTPRRRWWWQALRDAWRLSRGGEVR